MSLQAMAAATSASVASDFLKSSANLGRPRFNFTTRKSSIVAKVKKHEYPWPDDPDPNVKGGPLTHLSHFKPLKEKRKSVPLDFEKPLLQLEKKLIDVRKMANETGLDFTQQIVSLENKYQQALKDMFTHLTPVQRLKVARHPNRPTCLDHVFAITEKFVELHGDRAGYDDPALITGIGTIDGKRYMFIGHQKGRHTKENIMRNFGMPTPHGYRKALRMMHYADHHGFPIVTFIDTPGADPSIKSEELGQGEAIAQNLRTMFGLKVPIISIVIGEGGSGGALAIGCANKLLMLENAVFYVASPEACAAILWKDAKASPKAAEKLKITATELCKLQIADGIIPEPLGGAHADPLWTSLQIKKAINEAMDELTAMDTEKLLKHRMLKFRKIGVWQEGIPLDPERKINMKKKEEPVGGKTPVAELEGEVEILKEQISKAKASPRRPADFALDAMINKLKREIDLEYAEAVKALGLQDKFSMLREEFVKAKTKDQLMHPGLVDKVEKLKDEFHKRISAAPNFSSLKYKLNMLKEFSKTKSISEKNRKGIALKQEFNKKVKEVMDRPEMKAKMEALKAEHGKPDADENIANMRKEIELEQVVILKSMGFDVEVVKSKANSGETSLPDFKVKVESLKEEITDKIENVVNSSDLKNMIELLKLEVAKAGKNPDDTAKNKIEALEQKIKQVLADAINCSELKDKHESLEGETSSAVESNGSVGESLKVEV